MTNNDKTAPVELAAGPERPYRLDLMNRMKMHGMAEAFARVAGTTAQARPRTLFLVQCCL